MLFECHCQWQCPKTRDSADTLPVAMTVADVRESCKAFVPQLCQCYAIETAVDRNGVESLARGDA